MAILQYLIPAIIIVSLCALGMAVGVIFRGKSLQTCGRAAGKMANGDTISCPSCGGGQDSCKNSKAKASAH